MLNFVEKFEKFCETPNRKSGKAKSYANAIKYLCEFLDVNEINKENIQKLYEIEFLIKDYNSTTYNKVLNYLSRRGQSSYLKKGFLQAALPLFFKFYSYYNDLTLNSTTNDIILQELRDTDIKINYITNKLKRNLPIIENSKKHTYEISRKNGTAIKNIDKVRSGRKAEKYFIKFLNELGFSQETEFKDVANDKDYGFDVLFYDIGLEIKNIKNASFYLTDNEIAYLDKSLTHIILVDIDNGIWLLKNTSKWLQNSIKNIKDIRGYCNNTYENLDLTDIKINIDAKIKEDIYDLTLLSKQNFIELLYNN